MISFVTSNDHKFKEMSKVIPDIVQVKIDLDEIQETDSRAVVRHKLLAALEHIEGEVLVEDSSLTLECFKYELPGPFIKWFEKTLNHSEFAAMAEKLGAVKANHESFVGYAKSKDEMYFFEGVVPGIIVPPRGEGDFGFGPCFQPIGLDKTYGEISREEKAAISPRNIALKKLQEFLKQ